MCRSKEMLAKSMRRDTLANSKIRISLRSTFLFILFSVFISCSGGGNSGRSGGSDGSDFGCDGSCTNLNLTSAEVRQIISQGVTAVQRLSVNATFAVVDRVGNVLAVYQMDGAPATTTINGKIGASGGLEGVPVPSTLAAISKAGTGAFLSSQGNAFSTRTASQIIQENFNPGELSQPGGPLFGVQFSQLPCSDVTVLNSSLTGGLPSGSKFSFGGSIGPRPLPLGLSADPGGIPLYKGGDLVGGVGVEFDGQYTLDRNIADVDDDPEERVVMTASIGFEAPSQRVAPNMNVGKSLRYTDIGYEDLEELGPDLAILDDSKFIAVGLFTNGGVRDGSVFGDVESGVAETIRAGQAAAILVSPNGAPRYPTRAGNTLPGGEQLLASEVDALLDSALVTSSRARAAIRRPLDSGARVSIWVVDHLGVPLGFVRGQDAPVFGIDVSLQKARTVTFFSSPDAGDTLNAVRARNGVGSFEDYTGAMKAFAGSFILTGSHAFAARSVGNLARPFFTDGLNDNPNGPLSLPFPGKSSGRTWSPFNVGLQLDLVFQRLVAPLGIPALSLPDTCTDKSLLGLRLGNGMQIFPGAVPLYRGSTLIGALGISGDGIDQDDLTAFYGASRKGLDFIGHTDVGDPVLGFNAPREMRADQINTFPVSGTRLRYVNCPEGPFSGDNDQNVCDGL